MNNLLQKISIINPMQSTLTNHFNKVYINIFKRQCLEIIANKRITLSYRSQCLESFFGHLGVIMELEGSGDIGDIQYHDYNISVGCINPEFENWMIELVIDLVAKYIQSIESTFADIIYLPNTHFVRAANVSSRIPNYQFEFVDTFIVPGFFHEYQFPEIDQMFLTQLTEKTPNIDYLSLESIVYNTEYYDVAKFNQILESSVREGRFATYSEPFLIDLSSIIESQQIALVIYDGIIEPRDIRFMTRIPLVFLLGLETPGYKLKKAVHSH